MKAAESISAAVAAVTEKPDTTTLASGKRAHESPASSAGTGSPPATQPKKKGKIGEPPAPSAVPGQFKLVMGYRPFESVPIPYKEYPDIYETLQCKAMERDLSGFSAEWKKGRIIISGVAPPGSTLKKRVQKFIEHQFSTKNEKGFIVLYQSWEWGNAPKCSNPDRFVYTVNVPSSGDFNLDYYSSVMVRANHGLIGDWTMPSTTPPIARRGPQGTRFWLVSLVVSQEDADFIEERNGLLNAPGLGPGHKFNRVGVISGSCGAGGERPPPPNGGA